tara:strand:+ start:86 stop:3925 length:3840 start_codon:yes stop_codon:yes gene_type:complete
MAYQRSTKAQGFRQRVVPTNEVKQYTDLAKSLEKERKSTVSDYKAAANEQMTEMQRLSTLQNQEDVYELANLRQFSKTLNNTLDTVAKQIIKPITQGQIQDGINTAIRCQQGDEEACEAVKLNDEQELSIQAQVAEQRTKVNEATDKIEEEWDEAGFEADLTQKYRLLNLKKQNANFSIGYRRGMLMEAATGWDAYRDSILTGSSDDPIIDREVEHNGETYKVSDYYNIDDPKVKQKIVGALQGEYISRNGAGLSKLMVNKYLTNKVVERTNIFNQNEFNKGQREWGNTQLEYYTDQFENFTFSDLDSEAGQTTAQLGVQEFLNTSPAIMEAMGVEGSRNAAAKGKLIELLTDTLTSDNFKNIDDSEALLSFLEEDKFYIAGVSAKKKDGTYELSSLSDLFGSDLDTDALRAEVLESIAAEARKTLAGNKIQLQTRIADLDIEYGDDKVGYEIALGELYQSEQYYGKYWANAIFKQRDSKFKVTPPLDEIESRKRMKELEKQYDVKNGGKINIFNVNTQRIDANVLKEYKDKGVFADPYGGDEGAQKLHASGIVTLEKIVTDILGDRQIPEGEQELQAAAFVNWVSPKILSVAQKYSDLNNVDISDGIEYAIEYYTQKLKASNEFGGLSEENIPSLAEGDTDNVNLAIADEIGFNNVIYQSNVEALLSTDKQSKLHEDILQKANDAVANNNGYIFKKNSIVKSPVFFMLTDEDRPGIIFEALSRIDPLSTHPAVIYNDQIVKNGGKAVEWNDQIKAEIEEWKNLSVDTRKALTSNVDVRVNTALKKEGYISLTDLTQTLITPDGSIPVREDEYSALLVAAGVTDTFTYENFLARPDLVERVIKKKMMNGLALIQGTTNNNNETIRKLTAYMVTGDAENWNKGDFSNYSLEALNAYHSGSNERLNSLFNNNGLSLNNFKLDVPFSRDLIDTTDSVLKIDLSTVTSLEDLNDILAKFNELEVPDQKINIREYSMFEQESGVVSHQLRRILGKGWERDPNPEYARYIQFKESLEDKIGVMKVLRNHSNRNVLSPIGDFIYDSFLRLQFVDPNKVLQYQFYPAVEDIIGKERLETIREKANGNEDAILELLKLEPQFAGINVEPSAGSEITNEDINNERRLELEIEMLNIIHSGESTVDVTGNGYEAFNQGGSNEGKTVEGFSGTYGDHQANTGKKLTEMTIKDILANQDSGYNTKLYPFTKEGTEKWHKSGGIHAAGRYQFTRVGLREALKRSDLKETDLFSEINQDKLAMILLTQIGSSQWTSMAGNEKLEELLKKYKSIK